MPSNGKTIVMPSYTIAWRKLTVCRLPTKVLKWEKFSLNHCRSSKKIRWITLNKCRLFARAINSSQTQWHNYGHCAQSGSDGIRHGDGNRSNLFYLNSARENIPFFSWRLDELSELMKRIPIQAQHKNSVEERKKLACTCVCRFREKFPFFQLCRAMRTELEARATLHSPIVLLIYLK